MNKLLELQIEDIKAGVSFHAKRTVILFRDDDGTIKALKNVCRHQAGQFAQVPGGKPCQLRCPNHGWTLDLKKMEYVNPAGGLKHSQLTVDIAATGVVSVYEPAPRKYWERDAKPVRQIQGGELELTFYSHACMEIKAGKHVIFTDPWLEGPACTIGWWLVHLPPKNWLDNLANSSAIYISHNHSDHMHPHTLELLASRRKDNLIVVPKYTSGSGDIPLHEMGFTNVRALEFGAWFDLDADTRLMILPDTTGRDDSGLLVEYKGHKLLNTVDCSNVNDGVVPEQVDVLLAPFASASSGFPVCWEELYSLDKIQQIIDRNCDLSLQHFYDTVSQCRPKIAIPFAGYFREAHPDDRRIEEINTKNSPELLGREMAKRFPAVQYWAPGAGDKLDCATGVVTEAPGSKAPRSLESYNFEKYLAQVDQDAKFAPLNTLDGIRTYFQWAGFHANLVLHVIETDSTFRETIREFMFDFQTQELTDKRPDRPHQYSRFRVRSPAFRHALRRGLPWEDLSSGWQIRFYREPDVYEFDFWDHFQNKLPRKLPWVETART